MIEFFMFMLFINDIIQNISSDLDNLFIIDNAFVFTKSPEVLQSIVVVFPSS